RGGAAGKAPRRARLGRRQRPLPGLGAAHQPARRAREAVRLHGLPEPDARDQRGRGHVVSPARPPRAAPAGEHAAGTEVTSGTARDDGSNQVLEPSTSEFPSESLKITNVPHDSSFGSPANSTPFPPSSS